MYSSLVQMQRDFFQKGISKDLNFRKEQLKKLATALTTHSNELIQALDQDLKKPAFESWSMELYPCLQEIDFMLRHLSSFARDRKVRSPWFLWPAHNIIRQEPYGVALIMSAWNFPVNLAIMPLIGAIAAGNCAIIKPSEHAPTTSAVLHKIMSQTFDSSYVAVVEGDRFTGQQLLMSRFDYFFFTGNISAGKEVMRTAAENVTPLTLELGGKSPCIVDASASITTAARKIVWAKFINAGQNCLAPDFVVVHESVKAAFIEQCITAINHFYKDAAQSPDYGRIISVEQIDRLQRLMQQGNIVHGGEINRQKKYIAPTILDGIDWYSPIMQEEVFGPLLPILKYSSEQSLVENLKQQPKPLSLYIFSSDIALQHTLIDQLQSGSVCINDLVVQASSPHTPFGGVGQSGFGRYHGQASFKTFSYERTLMSESHWNLYELVRYPPYRFFARLLMRVMR